MPEAVIVEAVRTPMGKRGGKLSGWHPTDLLAATLSELVSRSGIDPATDDDDICGCVARGHSFRLVDPLHTAERLRGLSMSAAENHDRRFNVTKEVSGQFESSGVFE